MRSRFVRVGGSHHAGQLVERRRPALDLGEESIEARQGIGPSRCERDGLQLFRHGLDPRPVGGVDDRIWIDEPSHEPCARHSIHPRTAVGDPSTSPRGRPSTAWRDPQRRPARLDERLDTAIEKSSFDASSLQRRRRGPADLLPMHTIDDHLLPAEAVRPVGREPVVTPSGARHEPLRLLESLPTADVDQPRAGRSPDAAGEGMRGDAPGGCSWLDRVTLHPEYF